jgi:hypothetical protein
VLRLNNGLAQVGVDGRTMSSSNAAVQQSQQDVNYLALELNLYISILISIGTGLDIIKCPTWTPSRTVGCNFSTMKIRLLIIYGIIYGLTVVGFCIYWATNFGRHITYKGDEFFMLAQFLLILTYLFNLTIQFTVRRINYFLALAIPILTCITAFCIGVFFLLLTQLSGIPRHYILTYGLFYGLINLLAVYMLWGRTLKNV